MKSRCINYSSRKNPKRYCWFRFGQLLIARLLNVLFTSSFSIKASVEYFFQHEATSVLSTTMFIVVTYDDI